VQYRRKLAQRDGDAFVVWRLVDAFSFRRYAAIQMTTIEWRDDGQLDGVVGYVTLEGVLNRC
jgi:hypothetical protein